MDIKPITLTGRTIRLEPLSEDHVAGLTEVALDPSIWRYMLYGDIETEADVRLWVQNILGRQARGTDLPYTAILLESGKPVGCTRYMEIQPKNRSLEIGGTWYGVGYQRTGVNTEAKYLLLRHAFEAWGCVRIQIKTDLRNERSQRAIERIGATREGVLRNHMILPDGTLRSSVLYSILDSEWPEIKLHLEYLLKY